MDKSAVFEGNGPPNHVIGGGTGQLVPSAILADALSGYRTPTMRKVLGRRVTSLRHLFCRFVLMLAARSVSIWLSAPTV
jgi:hypothetical protein